MLSWPGDSSDEVLISCHACHPSLANDNLSGLTVATFLAQFLSGRDLRYSYRFLFIPGTIGAITWLARNREVAGRIRHGLVLTCIGDTGGFHYKKSRAGMRRLTGQRHTFSLTTASPRRFWNSRHTVMTNASIALRVSISLWVA